MLNWLKNLNTKADETKEGRASKHIIKSLGYGVFIFPFKILALLFIIPVKGYIKVSPFAYVLRRHKETKEAAINSALTLEEKNNSDQYLDRIYERRVNYTSYLKSFKWLAILTKVMAVPTFIALTIAFGNFIDIFYHAMNSSLGQIMLSVEKFALTSVAAAVMIGGYFNFYLRAYKMKVMQHIEPGKFFDYWVGKNDNTAGFGFKRMLWFQLEEPKKDFYYETLQRNEKKFKEYKVAIKQSILRKKKEERQLKSKKKVVA